MSVEVSQRSYKGEILYEDPFLFDTDFSFKNRAAAFTFAYDGYSKFELGDRVELSRKITKQYEAALVFAVRHVDVTQTSIAARFLGQTSYFANSLGFTQTLDLRESPLVAPRGLVINNTLDVASTAFGSDIQLIRAAVRIAYFLPVGPKSLTPGVVEDQTLPPLRRWFDQSSLAFGARAGIVHSLNHSGPDEPTTLPIDERFFNGGATTVRSFGERKLGPSDPKGNPIGGEFYTVFNVEYTFPIYGELQGALFFDAGNLLPTSEEPGVDDMRYALGRGLRHKLADWIADYRATIGDIRVAPNDKPGAIRAALPAQPPEHGESFENILADVDRLIIPGMVHWSHPMFLGYFGWTATAPGILGEIITAPLNVNAMTWRTSPAATELETVVIDWLRQWMGLPDQFDGVVIISPRSEEHTSELQSHL